MKATELWKLSGKVHISWTTGVNAVAQTRPDATDETATTGVFAPVRLKEIKLPQNPKNTATDLTAKISSR